MPNEKEDLGLMESKKILIIDDDPEICEQVTACLGELGYKAFSSLNGEEGLRHIANFSPNLVLLDMRMPGMDGLEVLKQINQRFPNLVVVMMTGVHDTAIATKAIELGACEYITKPIGLNDLMARFIRPILGDPD